MPLVRENPTPTINNFLKTKFMANIGGRNFTSFQNVRVKDTGAAPRNPQIRFEVGADSQNKDTTLSITLQGGSQEFPYLTVSNAGLDVGTGFIKMTAGSVNSTFRLSASQEADAALIFPHRTGKMPIAGTFSVGLETIAALYSYTTNVVVSGFRAEDLVLANIVTEQGTASTRGMAVLTGVRPSNSGLALSFFNVSTSATVAGDVVVGYVTIR